VLTAGNVPVGGEPLGTHCNCSRKHTLAGNSHQQLNAVERLCFLFDTFSYTGIPAEKKRGILKEKRKNKGSRRHLPCVPCGISHVAQRCGDPLVGGTCRRRRRPGADRFGLRRGSGRHGVRPCEMRGVKRKNVKQRRRGEKQRWKGERGYLTFLGLSNSI